MKAINYPAKIRYSKEDDSYLVEFPDLQGCLTEGVSLEDAIINAKEALSGYLSSIFERGFSVPVPSVLKGKGIYMIEPEPEVATPIMLRKMREELEINRLRPPSGLTYLIRHTEA